MEAALLQLFPSDSIGEGSLILLSPIESEGGAQIEEDAGRCTSPPLVSAPATASPGAAAGAEADKFMLMVLLFVAMLIIGREQDLVQRPPE